MNDIYIIAEAGVNHNGSSELAHELIDVASKAGADAIKFQTFITEKLVTRDAVKANYQLKTSKNDESQFSMLKKLEISPELHFGLFDYCLSKGVQFLSTAFEKTSLSFLANELNLPILKIPSGEITNGPLLLDFAKTGKDLILSTGMSTLDEIELALGIIAYGLLHQKESNVNYSIHDFTEAFESPEGKNILSKKLTLLHCTSEYPAKTKDINLNAMITMKNRFKINVGYSDHSQGIYVPISAATLGATIIEKHFTLNRNMSGPDHQASLEPDELKEMVNAIRLVGEILGDGTKAPSSSELENRSVSRKSLVALGNIKKGDTFSSKNLRIKRPGIGRSPMDFWKLLGEKSEKDYEDDEVIF